MTVNDIEKYFEDDTSLTEIISAFADTFERISYYQECLRNAVIDTPHETDKALKELVAIYSFLNVVARIAETYKINNEVKFYHSIKIEWENQGLKFTEKALDSEAKLQITNYRRVANIFEAYRDSCDRIISVLQSSLKSIEKEKMLHGRD